jgi:hypothetical protein
MPSAFNRVGLREPSRALSTRPMRSSDFCALMGPADGFDPDDRARRECAVTRLPHSSRLIATESVINTRTSAT